ncbi:hypothetical protein BGZ83_006862 [Gryganskiella cystojenkinii]|nr:hypothetical protein BGZ83_006862 [Gryganskiella cystojenkinii]
MTVPVSQGIVQADTGPLQYQQYQQLSVQLQQQQQSQTDPQQQQLQQQQQQQKQQQLSTKSLAITSSATSGIPPPPLMGSAICLVNDSTLHCFGGRLENRDLTNCHYVLDVETGSWETIQSATTTPPSSLATAATAIMSSSINPSMMLSLSLTTDPVETNSGSHSDALSIPPQPRYFHTLNAFGTSLVLFGGMGRVLGEGSTEQGQSGEKDAANDDKDDASSDQPQQQQQGHMEALNDLHVYDIITQRWQQKHPPVNQHSPKPRWAHMATVLDHYLVVIGGTDTLKGYVEDACVLDLQTWEWVSSIQNIGQCGTYRTVAATGPGKQSSTLHEPSSPSFPSSGASSPQTSANIAWPDSGAIDAMASISSVLSGQISAPSSSHSTSSAKEGSESGSSSNENRNSGGGGQQKQKPTERLMSGELTPAFKTGKEVPSIYLYSNYNFQHLQRELKVITPHYTHPTLSYGQAPALSSPPPSFSLVEKSQALSMMGQHELPPGLRFPQGHVYQNQLIISGTLMSPGKKPTLAIYAFNLTHYKWERLSTDTTLEVGSWNRTLLHPATGTLLVFGNYHSDAEKDYSNRLQHHDHLMMINLQAYGLYEKPIPSLPQCGQDLGADLLMNPNLCDMHVASSSGALFGACSTVLATRWPEFSTLLLSPPYVTPLILILPVPDEIVPVFLHYLYTGALPNPITPGIADYLLILARKYELNGLYALTMDALHQLVSQNPIRVHTVALMAGELGLQARAVALAMTTKQQQQQQQPSSSLPPALLPKGIADGKELPPIPAMGLAAMTESSTPGLSMTRRLSGNLTRTYSGRSAVQPPPPPPVRPPHPSERLQQQQMQQHYQQHQRSGSTQSMSTDGGQILVDGLYQQYTGAQRPPQQATIPEDYETEQQIQQQSIQRSMYSHDSGPNYAASYISTSSGGSNGYMRQQQQLNGVAYSTAYPSPISPSFQQNPFGAGVGTAGSFEEYQQQLQQLPLSPQQQQQLFMAQQQEYLQQQQLLFEQEHLRGQEMMVMEQHRLQHQRYLLKQQQIQQTATSVAESTTTSSSGGGGSLKSKEKEKDGKKEKGFLNKIKPPKPTVSGADLMKSAGF